MVSSSIFIKKRILIIFVWQRNPLRHWFYFLEDLMFDKKKRNKKRYEIGKWKMINNP